MLSDGRQMSSLRCTISVVDRVDTIGILLAIQLNSLLSLGLVVEDDNARLFARKPTDRFVFMLIYRILRSEDT